MSKNNNKEVASTIEALILKNFKNILDSEAPADIPASMYTVMIKMIEKYDLEDEEFDELVSSVIGEDSKDELIADIKSLLN